MKKYWTISKRFGKSGRRQWLYTCDYGYGWTDQEYLVHQFRSEIAAKRYAADLSGEKPETIIVSKFEETLICLI